ncbi:Uncharacterized protein BM_BM6253 [Brugia malayi]|uniref:Bm6253 n=1 Tax=Brugia malayi TaxID=6279 RepID=A0A4E9F628_BRUMA|nr:Uncharacterized protein BM_BM6253 [Brugia malayi]VIO90587.1 Uncharacterized protein BM_BM6253 [Brugia malayi]
MNAHMPTSSLCASYQEFHKSSSLSKIALSDQRSTFPPMSTGFVSKPNNTLPNDTQIQDTTASSNNNCICNRPASHIVCTRCGFELVGRLQKVCPDHPKKLALMDHRECPNRLCKSIHLIEVSLQQ